MISQSQSDGAARDHLPSGQRSISAPSDPAPTAAVKPGLPNGLTAHSAAVGEIIGPNARVGDVLDEVSFERFRERAIVTTDFTQFIMPKSLEERPAT